MSRRILVGRFGAPHGIRGEIRLQSFTRDPKAIAGYGPLAAADGRTFELTSARTVKDNILVARVAGILNRTAAEALTSLQLFVDRTALPPAHEDEFYVADLIGMVAVDADGLPIGTIVDVPNYGGGDLVAVRPTGGGETLLFPFTRDVVPAIDVCAGKVTIVPPDEVEAEDGAEP